MEERPTILLVEDEENIAIAVEILMERAGYDVLRVRDGDQALPHIRAQIPTLVILDVTLPGMSGYEICQQMRRDPALSAIPVLMMSARASGPERRKAMAMGADIFLPKPFAIEDLQTHAAQLIKGGRHEN